MRSLLFLLFIFNLVPAVAQEYRYPYAFFTNASMPGTWFFSKTDSSGGSVIFNENGKLPVSMEIYHTPGNSLELLFNNAPGGYWHAAFEHQQLRGVEHYKDPMYLSFWLLHAGGPIVDQEMPAVQIITYHNFWSEEIPLNCPSPGKWQRYVIPLERFGSFGRFKGDEIKILRFSQQEGSSGGPYVFYIDDVELVSNIDSHPVSQLPVLTEAKGFDRHVDIAWEPVTDPNVRLVKIYRSENLGEYTEAGIQQPYVPRYADYTGVPGKEYSYRISFLNADYEETELSLPVETATRAMSDDEMLSMVQEACFRYYWDGAEPVSGMARENIPGRHNMVATGASGFGIMALIVGTERNFITRRESVDWFLKILAFLEKADRFHGVYGHFMDGPTGKIEPFFGSLDNGADLVETAFLLQGLLAARKYFDREDEKERMIRGQITRIWEEAEFDWFRKDPDSKYLYWHWSPDQ